MSKLDASMEQLLTRLDKLKHNKQNLLKELQEEKNNILKEICTILNILSCKGKQFIPDVVKTSPNANEMSKLETRMEQLLVRLDKLKHEKQDRLKQLQKEKDKILKEIRDLRKKINDHLYWMEKNIVSDVESRFAGKIQTISQSVETVNNITSSVAESRKTIQGARNINDAEMFVQIKQGQKNLSEHERSTCMKEFSSEGEMRVVKLFPNSLKDVLFSEKDNIFGQISEIIIPKSIEHFGDFSVRQQSDEKTCIISDVCLTAGDSILCSDYSNNKLKKLDRSYDVIEHLDLPSTPSCLCEVDSSQLAVTLWYDKKVQFVFQQPLKLGRCFTVGDVCRGIDCHDGKLYVCCGGYEKEGPGHIEVYDINGSLLRTFYEGLIKPFHIKVASDDELFVADEQGSRIKLLKVNSLDFRMSEIHIKTLTDVARFCRIGEGQLCMPGRQSKKIMLISTDGEHQHELLVIKDGKGVLWTVLFNEKQLRLVVSLRGLDVIKVYHLIV